MAIKISVEGKLSKVLPDVNTYFDIPAMKKLVGGYPYPTRVGPIWIIQNERLAQSKQNFNKLASQFFRTSIFGDIIALSTKELPDFWELEEDDEDKKYTADEFDAGIVKAITEMSIYENYQYSDKNNDIGVIRNGKIEYVYFPNAQEITDDLIEFLKIGYSYIDFNSDDYVIYEDKRGVVRVKGNENKIKTLEQMLEIFVAEEDYDKAIVLRDTIKKLKTND